jgi:hypothetical protein
MKTILEVTSGIGVIAERGLRAVLRTIGQLRLYKELDPRWTDCENVTAVCRAVATGMV